MRGRFGEEWDTIPDLQGRSSTEEHRPSKPRDAGSNPAAPANFYQDPECNP